MLRRGLSVAPRASGSTTQQRRCYSDKAASAASAPEVLINSVNNGKTTAHVVTLNRPKALNALNMNMIRIMYPQYRNWIADDRTSMVIMKGAGDKAFCAGGDIRQIYDAGRVPGADKSIMKDFFHEEYNLNYIIGCFNKPHIAILNGITMGGGVGLSVHGSVRIATENSVFAMPETGIGFFPDVGGSFFLPRLQSRGKDDRYFWPVNPVGLYLALTGARLKGPELYLAGIATNYVEAARLPELEKELVNTKFNRDDEIYDLIESYNSPKLPQIWEDKTMKFAPFKAYLNPVLDSFGFASLTKCDVEHRINLLMRESNAPDWAKNTIKTLQSVSPVSLKVTNELMLRGAGLSLGDCLRMEFVLSQNFMKNHDFFEGVRALLVDKDKNPKWKPAKLEEVTEEMVESYFEADTELVLPDELEQQKT